MEDVFAIQIQPLIKSYLSYKAWMIGDSCQVRGVEYNKFQMKRREFRVSPLKEGPHYEALADKHLQYFFASKLNRKVLVKTRIVNRRNEIIDRDICKLFQNDSNKIANSFRLKKTNPKPSRYSSINSRNISDAYNKTVGKKQFEEFLQNQRNQIKKSTLLTPQQQKSKTNKSQQLILHQQNLN